MTATDSPTLRDQTVTMYGVLVELEFTHDHGEVVSSCFLSVENRHGRYQGSLGLCQDRGGIPYFDRVGYGEQDETVPDLYLLSNKALDSISRWAETHGY